MGSRYLCIYIYILYIYIYACVCVCVCVPVVCAVFALFFMFHLPNDECDRYDILIACCDFYRCISSHVCCM